MPLRWTHPPDPVGSARGSSSSARHEKEHGTAHPPEEASGIAPEPLHGRPDTSHARSPLSRRARLLGVLACAAAVLACEALVFRHLFQYGVSNIWYADGATQHFPAFLYFHEWLTAVLNGHGANYGMWSWRLGMGADVLTTLSYYICDPFALIGLLFPVHLLEYVYEGLFFLRVLCAGLAGYLYLRTMKATRLAAIAGTLVYTFAGFALQAGLKHPYFVDAMIWFPLILLGTELVLARRRWYLLVGAIFLAAVSNFYFFYQLGIVAIIYAVARYLEITERGQRLRRLAREGLRVAGWYLLGTALAAASLVPMVLAVLASSRSANHYSIALFCDARTYCIYLVSLISAFPGGLGGGFAVIGILAAIVVFLRRSNGALRVMLVAFVLFAISPFFGSMFNGFSFASYRFYFMAGLFLGAAVAAVLSDPAPLTLTEIAVTGVGIVALWMLEGWACSQVGYDPALVYTQIRLGAFAWALLAAERLTCFRLVGQDETAPWRRLASTALRVGVVALLVAGISASGTANYSKQHSDTLSGYLPIGTALARYQNDAGTLISSSLHPTALQRVDKQQGAFLSDLEESHNNDPLVQRFAGLDFYYSVMDDGQHEYLKGLVDRSKRFAYDFQGLDDRAALDTLAGVKYYIAPAEGASYVPYGFVRSSTLGTETVYTNRYALPVGYVYHSVVTSETYAALSPLGKQQSLLQGVVLADGQAPKVPRIQPVTGTTEVTYTLTPSKGLTWNTASRSVTAKKAGATADLSFTSVPNAELYVEMTGIRYLNDNRLHIGASTTGARKVQWFISNTGNQYWGGNTLLINLGYFAHGTTRARIVIVEKRHLTYNALKVIAIPMTHYAEQVGALAAEGMRDVKVGADTLSGTVTSHGSGVLFLSVPYNTGWSATVDGRPARTMRANVGFTGIAVSSGTHRVVLRYVTPGLRIGELVSLLALLVAVALAVRNEMRLAAARRDATDGGGNG
jgi:uncharacterized membrane protein YfhO